MMMLMMTDDAPAAKFEGGIKELLYKVPTFELFFCFVFWIWFLLFFFIFVMMSEKRIFL